MNHSRGLDDGSIRATGATATPVSSLRESLYEIRDTVNHIQKGTQLVYESTYAQRFLNPPIPVSKGEERIDAPYPNETKDFLNTLLSDLREIRDSLYQTATDTRRFFHGDDQ